MPFHPPGAEKEANLPPSSPRDQLGKKKGESAHQAHRVFHQGEEREKLTTTVLVPRTDEGKASTIFFLGETALVGLGS